MTVGDHLAQGRDPFAVRLGEVAEHVVVDHRLIARMADTEAYPLVVVADMLGDRAQPVVAGDAAAHLDSHLGGRKLNSSWKTTTSPSGNL